MSNTGFKGVDVRQNGSWLIFRAFLTASGAVLSTGTTSIELFEIQSDGSLKAYDWGGANANTFQTAATTLNTPNSTMTEQTYNNNTTHTGVWTKALSTLTGFTIGAVYLIQVSNSSADVPVQTREFQYGGAEGDFLLSSGGFVGINWGNIGNSATSINFSGTTINTVTNYTGNTPQTGDVYAQVTNATYGLNALLTAITGVPTAVWGATTRTLSAFGFTVNAMMTGIISTALSEGTAGWLAASFKKFFNVGTPTSTMNEITLVDTVTILTNAAPDSATVTNINAIVSSGTYGNAALLTVMNAVGTTATNVYNIVNSGTYGNAALLTVVNAVGTAVVSVGTTSTNIYAIVDSGTYGNAALLAAIQSGGGGGGGGGTGAELVTITVNDGTNPIQNAVVTLMINASKYFSTTNTSGVAQLAPNEGNGTYTVALQANGYQFIPTTLVVNGNTSQTYSMTQQSITPSPAGTVTGYTYCYDVNNSPEAGVSLTLILTDIDGSGRADDNSQSRTQVSNSSGLVEFTNLVIGATYSLQYGATGNPVEFIAADQGGGIMQMPNCQP